LFAIDIRPHSCEVTFIIMDFDRFYNILGHPHNVNLKETAKANNIQLTGVNHIPCTHCAEAKIRMKHIPKESIHTATIKSERFMIDHSCI
jgi:hypothetical protein